MAILDRRPHTYLLILLGCLTALAATGCHSTTTRYIHPNADLGAIKKVAVLPFENVTQERTAGDKIQKIFLVELLSMDVFDVIEPGAVTKTLKSEQMTAVDSLSPADLKRIGAALGADGIMLGSVVDFEEARSGSTPTPNVTIQLRLVETQTGATVWSASQTRSGAKATARLFGIGGESLTEAAREVVRDELRTLLK